MKNHKDTNIQLQIPPIHSLLHLRVVYQYVELKNLVSCARIRVLQAWEPKEMEGYNDSIFKKME